MTLPGPTGGLVPAFPTAGGPGTPAVQWDRLVLVGFPPFAEPAVFDLSTRLAVVAEPDETRRRAIMAGLAAILADASEHAAVDPSLVLPLQGEGRLDFTLASGESYTLRRVFATGHGTLVEVPRAALVPAEDGPSPPLSSSSTLPPVTGGPAVDPIPVPALETRMASSDWALSLVRERLLSAAEVLVMPPGAFMSSEPASLGGLIEAREASLDARARDLDVTARELDRLAGAIFPAPVAADPSSSADGGSPPGGDDLVARIDAGRSRAREAVDRAEAECTRAEREVRDLEIEVESGQKQAMRHRWVLLTDQQRSVKTRLDRSADVLRKARIVEAEIADWRRRLEEEPAHGVIDVTSPQRLDTLGRLERDRVRLEERVALLVGRIGSLAAETPAEGGPPARGKGGAQGSRKDGAEAAGQDGAEAAGQGGSEAPGQGKARADGKPAPAVEAPAADKTRPLLPDFATLGTPAVSTCTSLLEQRRKALRMWQQLQSDTKRLADLDRRIAKQGSAEVAPASFLDFLGKSVLGRDQRPGETSRAAVAAGQDGADDARRPERLFCGAPELRGEAADGVEETDFQKVWVARERVRLQEAEAELGGRSMDLIPAIRAKIRLVETADAQAARAVVLQAQLDRISLYSDKAALALFGLGVVVGAGVAAYHVGLESFWDLVVSGLVAGTLLGIAGMAVTAFRTADLRSALEAPKRERKAVDQKLGKLAGEPPEQLALYLERAERLVERRRALNDIERKMARARATAEARQQKKEAARDAAGTKPGSGARQLEADGPLNAVVALYRERDQLALELETLCHNEWKANPHEAPRIAASRAGGRWESLARLAVVMDRRPAALTVAELVGWLETLDDAWWEKLAGQAREFDARAAEASGSGAATPAPAAPAVDPRAQQRARIAGELTRQRDEAERELAAIRKELPAFLDPMKPLLALVKGDLAAARELWRSAAAARQGLLSREATLRRVLATVQCGDVASLQASVSATQAEMERMDAEIQQARDAMASLGPDTARSDEQVSEARQRLEVAGERLAGLQAEMARLRDGPLAFFEGARLDAVALQVRKAEFARRVARLGPAWRAARVACRDRGSFRQEQLAAEIDLCFQLVSGGSQEHALMDRVGRLAVATADEPGRPRAPEPLARDRLLLGAHLAAANVAAQGMRVPLVVDVSGLASDETRGRLFRDAVERVAGERQVIVLGHPRDLGPGGAPSTYPRS